MLPQWIEQSNSNSLKPWSRKCLAAEGFHKYISSIFLGLLMLVNLMQRAVVPSWLSYLNKTSWFICFSVKIRCIMQLLACVGYWDNVVEIPFKTMMLQIVPFIVLSGPPYPLYLGFLLSCGWNICYFASKPNFGIEDCGSVVGMWRCIYPQYDAISTLHSMSITAITFLSKYRQEKRHPKEASLWFIWPQRTWTDI